MEVPSHWKFPSSFIGSSADEPSLACNQSPDIARLHRTINWHQEIKEELEDEIKSVNKTYTTKCQEFIEQKEEFEKANIRVQN